MCTVWIGVVIVYVWMYVSAEKEAAEDESYLVFTSNGSLPGPTLRTPGRGGPPVASPRRKRTAATSPPATSPPRRRARAC